jgi:hypothetical protein
MSQVRFIARYQAMAANEILKIIPASEYNRIKAEDPSPIFRAYIVGHEGDSAGKVVGAGTVVARWFRSAIENLYHKIQHGLKIFHEHAATNDLEGRTPIGEIVGKSLRWIKDRLSVVAIAYIKPEFRGLPLDVASIEADINFKEDRLRKIYTADVRDVTAIALGNSEFDRPGFAGATLLAQVQAFANKKSHEAEGANVEGLTAEDVREFFRTAKGVKPSDFFGNDALAEDPAVKGMIETEKRRAGSSEFADKKRLEETWAKEKKELTEKLETANKTIAAKDGELVLTKVPALFEKEATDRKLTDQQKKFIKPRLDKFKATAPEKIEAEFKVHLDKELDEFKTTAELFGIKIVPAAGGKKDEKAGGDGKDKATGAEPEESKGGEIADKYLDPAQNPMIPK